MNWLNPSVALENLQQFLEMGGDVLLIIMFATFFMWAFILERLAYYQFAHGKVAQRAFNIWGAREDHKSWTAHMVREQLISEVRQKTEQNMSLVKTLVAIAPLLGLLGTVTGMIEVFDVMAATGSSNVRAMSAGVSKATIPTMAGMVAALSGLIFTNRLERRGLRETRKVADGLELG
ncbi:MAG: MotA/TolQ/ExbB proton channel family protein [Robiginitomaculum sp.]|nr:MotA/TolQ/ExbB proton channel family protein [Robiginitomaculum sp.]